MPTLLDEDLARSSLAALVGWSGGTERFERTVQLPPDQDAELRRRVAETADAMDHHPVVEDVEGGTRYVLWTHSAGGVTELDVALASRITDLHNQVTGQQGATSRPRQDAPDVPAEAGRASGGPGYGPGYGGQDEGPLDTPTVGVPGAASGTPQVPLPDARPGAPEPGATPEQEPGPLTGR